MKRSFLQTGAASAALCGFLLFAACAPAPVVGKGRVELRESGEGYAVIEVTAQDAEASLYDALMALGREGALTVEGTEGEFGFYLEALDGVREGDGKYWFIYTSLTEYGGVTYSDASWGTYTYDGEVYAAAAFGMEGMPLIADTVYIFALGTYAQ